MGWTAGGGVEYALSCGPGTVGGPMEVIAWLDRQSSTPVCVCWIALGSPRSSWAMTARCADRSKRDFRAEVVGPINRIAEFVSNETIRTIIGQRKCALDVGGALDRGEIILANLAGGDYVDAAHTELLGRLLVRMFFFHAKRRHQKPITPYWLYLDECQLYLSGDIQQMLAEVRKFGLGVVLSHQFLSQLGEPDDELRCAVRNSTKLKAVFNIADHVDAEDLAQSVMTLNLEQPVNASVRPTVIGHQRVQLASDSMSEQTSTTSSRSRTEGESISKTRGYGQSVGETFAEGVSSAASESSSIGDATSQAFLSGTGSGISTVEMMSPTTGWLSAPNVVGVSEGASSMVQSSQSSGVSSISGRARGTISGNSSMHAVSTAESFMEAVSRGRSAAETAGQANTYGTSTTRGTSEAFEPVYALLPTSFHSKENALYMAAQMLRCLKTGSAYIRYFDRTGARETFLAVPAVVEHTIAETAFEELRDRVLAASPAASTAEAAREHVAARERAIINAATLARTPPEPTTPAEYRIKRNRPAPEPKSPADYRTKKTRPAKEEKGKA
jgi:hypothetical protein